MLTAGWDSVLSLSQGLQHLLAWEHLLLSTRDRSSRSCCPPVSSGPGARHRAGAASPKAPCMSCQACVFREMWLEHKPGLLWKFGSASPSGCNSSSGSSSPPAPVGAGGSRLQGVLLGNGAGILGISAGLEGKQMQSGPNKPESMRVILGLV